MKKTILTILAVSAFWPLLQGQSLVSNLPADYPPVDSSFLFTGPADARSREVAIMRAIADLALIPPVINTSPGPEYDAVNLDYGMNIGMDRTPGGRIWAAWVGGEDGPGAYFIAATSDDNGETWSRPRLVIDAQSPGLPLKRSVLIGNFWTDPRGRLWLFFDQAMNQADGRGGLWFTRCDDPDAEAPRWSEPRRIWHGAMLNKPTVLSSGEWIFSAYLTQHTTGVGPFRDVFPEYDKYRGVNILVSKDEGETFEYRACIPIPSPDWQEAMTVERQDGSLWMLARSIYGIVECGSTDGGRTWSDPVRSAIPHPNSRFFVRRLASGRILLIKNWAWDWDGSDASKRRNKMSAWLSEDDGKTWKGGLILDERQGVTYPDGFQAPDGTIYISYDRNRALHGEVLLARFTEEDVLSGRLISPGSKLNMIVSKPLKIR